MNDIQCDHDLIELIGSITIKVWKCSKCNTIVCKLTNFEVKDNNTNINEETIEFRTFISGFETILQEIYNSEINISISWFWDAGFDLKIGDDFNGYVYENQFYSIEELKYALLAKLFQLCPQSEFVRKWKS